MTNIDRLRQFEHFADVPAAILTPLLPYVTSRTFARGEAVWRQGGAATDFTFVASGHLKIVKQRRDGHETILGLFHPGDAVGQVAVQQGMPYPAMAIAMSDVEILAIPRARLLGVMGEHPPLMTSMVGDMTRRARDLVTRIDELTASGAEQRLAALFLTLADKLGTADNTGTRIDLSLSRQELADLINVRVETAIRIMSRWNKEGPIRTDSDGFLIETLELVRQLAEQSE